MKYKYTSLTVATLTKRAFRSAVIRTKFQVAKNIGSRIDFVKFHRLKKTWEKTLSKNGKNKAILNINPRSIPLSAHPNANKYRDYKQTFYQWTTKRLQGGSRRERDNFNNLQIFRRLSQQKRQQMVINQYEITATEEAEKVREIFMKKLHDELNKVAMEIERTVF